PRTPPFPYTTLFRSHGLVRALLTSPALLRRTALASVAANVGIVLTGGVVRLTDSGMGCPDWPRCDAGSVVATPRLGIHGVIESGDRKSTRLNSSHRT